jgi:hypothetical protein
MKRESSRSDFCLRNRMVRVTLKVGAANIQDGYEIGYFENVVDFVTAKAPNNKI